MNSKNILLVALTAITLLLGGCSSGPSETDVIGAMQAQMQQEREQIIKMTGSLGKKIVPEVSIDDLTILESKAVSDNLYAMKATVTMTSGKNTKSVDMDFKMFKKDGVWRFTPSR